jgi:hypothetical protein
MENIKKHRPAAITLYHLLQDCSLEFRQMVDENEAISILKFNPYFSSVFA